MRFSSAIDLQKELSRRKAISVLRFSHVAVRDRLSNVTTSQMQASALAVRNGAIPPGCSQKSPASAPL
jgi:hypothetical protein